MRDGDIVWFKGLFSAVANRDNTVLRRFLKNRLLPNEVVIADDGYTDNQAVTKEDAVGFETCHFQIRARH